MRHNAPLTTATRFALYELQAGRFWNALCTFRGVLRITTNTSDKLVMRLEGRLVGPWVQELIHTLFGIGALCQTLEIDVADLTFADDDGEKTLCWLHRMGTRFRGKGTYSEYLFERLKIPLHPRNADACEKGDHMSG